MKAMVVVGHPAPGSFNHSIAEAIRATWEQAGCEVWFHDLVEEEFDPRLTAGEARGEASADPLERMWRDCILSYCGVRHVMRSLFGVIATSSDDERRGWLAETASLANKAVALAKNSAT